MVLPTTVKSSRDEDYGKGLGSTVKIQDVDYGAFEKLNLHHGTTFQDVNGSQRHSFEHVPFQENTFSFDDKYNMQGRFAFDVDELPFQPKHRGRSSHQEIQFSKLSACTKTSTSEDSTDTG